MHDFTGRLCYLVHQAGDCVVGVITFWQNEKILIKLIDEIFQDKHLVNSEIDVIFSLETNIQVHKCRINNIDTDENIFDLILLSTELITNQRKSERFSVNFYANAKAPEKEKSVIIVVKNIGKDGLLFTTNENFKKTKTLEISFYRDNQKFSLNTHITRKLKKNIFEYGAKIIELTNSSTEHFYLYMDLLKLNQEKLKNNLVQNKQE